MSSLPSRDPVHRMNAKEYIRFCRLRGLFLADGLETWRLVLEQRKVPPGEVAAKLAAAALFIQGFGQTFEPEISRPE